MKICLFGGSFDPVHLAHQKIAKLLLADYDEVWVIVSAASPFKNQHQENFNSRYEMCKIAFAFDRVKVLDVENKYKLKYTVDVVEKLTQMNPNYKFDFAIGTDNVKNLDKWKDIDKLKKLVEFKTFSRNGEEADYSFDEPYSSTVVRITKETGISEVDNYIKENSLYKNLYQSHFDKVKEVMSEKRFFHTINVYETILELAKTHNIDVKKCALAAIYHDYLKEQKQVVEKFMENSEYKNFPYPVMHGIAFPYVCGHLVDNDEEILFAIKYHTTGHDLQNDIGKLLYIADYLEPSRDFYDELKYLLDEAKESIAVYSKLVFKRNKYLEKTQKKITREVEELTKVIMEEENGRIEASS